MYSALSSTLGGRSGRPFSLEAFMTGNVTNLLLAQMLLPSRRPDSGGRQRTGQIDPGLVESENARMLGETRLGNERTQPDVDSWDPQQAWNEEHRWPADDEFLPSP